MAIRKWQGWSSVQTRVTALMLAMAFLALFGLVMSRSSETHRAHAYLAAEATEHGELLDRTLELEGASLETFAKDYTNWGEMVQFVQTGDSAWASVNIDDVLTTYRANAAWVFDTAGLLVYAARDSTMATAPEPVAPGLPVKALFGGGHFCWCFIAGPDGPIEIRGATIHPSDDDERKTPVRGYFLAARLWNKPYLAELTRLTGKKMDVERAGAETMPSAEINQGSGGITFLRPLPGRQGRPEMVLTALLRPGWFAMARRTGRSLFVQQTALAMLGVLLLTLVLWLWVTRPLGRLARSLQSGTAEALKPLERSRTEFGQLAHLVGQFFGQNAALVKEVAERKQAEQALRANEEKYRNVVENASEAIIVLQDGRVKFANPRASELAGFTLDEFKGSSFLEFVHPDDRQMVGGNHLRRLKGEQVETVYSLRLIVKDGRTLWVEVRVALINWEGRPAVLDFLTDITKRKEAEVALARKNTELAALNEQKNQFLGMAAHDLRNPLAVILNYCEFILGGYVGTITPEQTKFIATMKRSSEFMLKLVNDLLDVARIEAGKVNLELEPTDLAALLNQNIALNRVLAGKKDIRLELEVAADLPTMELDPAKIEQVLNNLVSNAVKFSNPGSTVSIRLWERLPSRDVATRMSLPLVTISVADHGPGIPPDDMGKLFTAFGRTSIRSASGEKDTGLGLLIVKRILEAHHGTIEVKSEVGKGTTFLVTLPGTKPSKRHEEPAGARGVGAVSSTENSGGDNA